ncbi:MAG: hypothetical protein IKR71_00830, partial [Bacteroidales bacterium]|nr:hypothetical protein [Bacteroidales bacterium]
GAFASSLDIESEERLTGWLKRNKCGNHYLAIRDSMCTGLTGDPRSRDSNIHKLLYGFLNGKDSTHAADGGSYGVGKTVFLHFGIGFVCYYSRTEKGQRLSLFYCYNNDGERVFSEKFMPFQLAWWGRHEKGDNEAAYPVEDDTFIKKFLEVFQVAPYANGETGTMIIVPFFNLRMASGETTKFTPWLSSIDDYLRFSVLKWYVPRFRGDLKAKASDDGGEFLGYPGGRYLRCMFPDRKPLSLISSDSVSVAERKIFGLIRDLYDAALGRAPLPEGAHKITVGHKNSPRNNVYFSYPTIGWFAVKKINYSEGEFADTQSVLQSLSPEGGIDDRKGFVLYCRKPGMIMTYDDSWGKVLSQVNLTGSEFMVGIFVVNSDNCVYSDPAKLKKVCQLDQLFRETEKSDHYGWPPDSTSHGLKLINSIIGQLRSEVARRYSAEEVSGQTKAKGDISRGLGGVFMTGRTGFGGTQLFAEGNGGIDVPDEPDEKQGGKASRAKKTRIKFGAPRFSLKGESVRVTVPCRICAAKNDCHVRLEVAVETDSSPINAATWNASDGPYPIMAEAAQQESAGKIPVAICSVDENEVAFDIDLSNAIDVPVKCLLSYLVSRTDMSTLLIRKEA